MLCDVTVNRPKEYAHNEASGDRTWLPDVYGCTIEDVVDWYSSQPKSIGFGGTLVRELQAC